MVRYYDYNYSLVFCVGNNYYQISYVVFDYDKKSQLMNTMNNK